MPEVARFFSIRNHGNDSAGPLLIPRLKWLARNPAVSADVPLGWMSRSDDDTVCGAMLCIPTRFVLNGDVEPFQMSSAFFVDPALPGSGVPIFLSYRSLDRKFVLYAGTANEDSCKIWQACNGKPLPQTEYELLGPLRWSALLEEVAYRKLGTSAARVVSSLRAFMDWHSRMRQKRGWQEFLSPVTDASVAVVEPSARKDRPQLLRDSAFLKWRYTDLPNDGSAIYRFRDRNSGADGYVGVTVGHRGYRDHIRVATIADVWGDIGPDSLPLLISCIAGRYSPEADMIATRTLPPRYMEAARKTGMLRRNFTQPIAWYIDRRGLVPSSSFFVPPAAAEMI